MAREIRKEADLIFMPYNYVLDFKVYFVNITAKHYSTKAS